MPGPETALVRSPHRPLAATLLAIFLLLTGAVLFLAGMAAMFVKIETQIVVNPLHHALSIRLNHWELAMLAVALALWFAFTGRGLWRMQRPALISAWGIFVLIFVRGLLIFVPPVDHDDLKAALWLMGIAASAMLLLRQAARGLKPE